MSTKEERAKNAAQARRWRKTPAGKAAVRKQNNSANHKRARAKWEAEHPNHGFELRQRQKQAVLNFFGSKCLDCSTDDPDILTLDHVGGGGRPHRRKVLGRVHAGGMIQWAWRFIRDNKEIPVKLELVCRNCNWKRHLKKLRESR
jgi:hypothetical protein